MSPIGSEGVVPRRGGRLWLAVRAGAATRSPPCGDGHRQADPQSLVALGTVERGVGEGEGRVSAPLNPNQKYQIGVWE